MELAPALRGPIARQAWPGTALAGALAIGAGALGWSVAAALLALAALANLAFFRNPRRRPPAGDGLLTSPADGRVMEIEEVEDPDGFVAGSCTRIAIFLSIFNVHINPAPCDAKVRAIRRKGARFLAAFRPQASDLNVQSRLDLEMADGTRLAVVQITGLVARRIVSYPRVGDTLERGQPYGLICYGSRVEVYLPAGAQVRVAPGDRVRGGGSVIAELAS